MTYSEKLEIQINERLIGLVKTNVEQQVKAAFNIKNFKYKDTQEEI